MEELYDKIAKEYKVIKPYQKLLGDSLEAVFDIIWDYWIAEGERVGLEERYIDAIIINLDCNELVSKEDLIKSIKEQKKLA